jgi:ATP-binding cassette subfamily B multidrug efflux pump
MRALRRLWRYFLRYRSAYLLGFGCLLVSNFMATLGPRYVQHAIDALIAARSHAAEVAALWIAGIALVGGVFRFGMRYLLNGVSRRVETDLRNDLFSKLMSLSATFFQAHPVGDLMARSTNDLLALRMVAGPAIMYLVDTSIRALMTVPMMALISPSLTLWALLPTMVLPVVMIGLGGEVHRRSLAVQDQFGDISSFVQEHLGGIRVIRAYAQESAETTLFHALDRGYFERNMALARAQGVFNPLLSLLAGSGAIVVLLVGGRQVVAGRISVGQFVAFGVYLATLVWPMIALGWAISLLQRGDAATDRVNALFDAQPDVRDPPAPITLHADRFAHRVDFEHVWFRYPGAANPPWALEDVTFSVPAGAVAGIVGATGSGKSTVTELLLRNYDPDRGRILLDGVDIRQLALGELRRVVALVPQETFLFSETLRDNVLLGVADDARLGPAAQTSRLVDALPDLPAGWDTLLGERGINLSGGQRQRAAIARALVRQPGVIVLDDSLSAVDADTEAAILAGLQHETSGRTRIIISHRSASVRDADEILVFDRGRIVERGGHEALVAAAGRYVTLLRRQEVEQSLAAADG